MAILFSPRIDAEPIDVREIVTHIFIRNISRYQYLFRKSKVLNGFTISVPIYFNDSVFFYNDDDFKV